MTEPATIEFAFNEFEVTVRSNLFGIMEPFENLLFKARRHRLRVKPHSSFVSNLVTSICHLMPLIDQSTDLETFLVCDPW
jgi:hypothetical protein